MLKNEELNLKYPTKYALMPYYEEELEGGKRKNIIGYCPTPCYVISNTEEYYENGTVNISAKVFFLWEVTMYGYEPVNEKLLTLENYSRLIKNGTEKVERLFNTYEDCKAEAYFLNAKARLNERYRILKKMYPEFGDETLKSIYNTSMSVAEKVDGHYNSIASVQKRIDDRADKLYEKTTNPISLNEGR